MTFSPILSDKYLLDNFQEIDELCNEWVPEPLIPQITDEMKYDTPVLER